MKPLRKIRVSKRLEEALDTMEEMTFNPPREPEFQEHYRQIVATIQDAFGANSSEAAEFPRLEDFGCTDAYGYWGFHDEERFGNRLDEAVEMLKWMIQEIGQSAFPEAPVATLPARSTLNVQTGGTEVFLVHGRDEGAKDAVARFLSKLGVRPVILAELPGEGRTIIEKFEAHADVAFAVVLLTPDDVGALQSDRGGLNARARQNVIFELGFFIGRLGRRSVLALTKGDVEIPSDYAGVEYIPFDASGGWCLPVIRELQAAGLAVDASGV